MIKKLMTEFRNVPTRKWAEPTVKMIDEKSILPAKISINGLMILETKDLTMAVNADPTMIPRLSPLRFHVDKFFELFEHRISLSNY